MKTKRIFKIKELWNSVHGRRVPCFYWKFHPDMYYWYNECINCIECDCGLRVPVNLKYEELTEMTIRELIKDMEYKIYADYKKMGWDIGIWED